MRLVCVNDNGETVDVEAVLRQEPYTARGLLADALAHCHRTLPDSLEYLQAERAVREILRNFQGDQDKYAKSYVLSRTLDTRIQKTPRADLFRLALHRGGPLAFVGMFYATFDVQRNLRNRETLDYLLNKATDESKLQLIMRSSTFPCNPSTSNWLFQIFEKLRPNAQNLACILRCLGTTSIPRGLFRRLWMPSLSWGSNGEAMETNAYVTMCIASEQKFTDALYDLEYVGFVRTSATIIDLDKRIAEFLRLHFEHPTWIVEVVRILAHAFPKHRALEATSYLEECKGFMPQLESVFSYLNITPLDSLVVDRLCLAQFTEVCLSASHFGGKSWKYRTISIATQAVGAIRDLSADNAVLAATIDARKSFLALLYQERTMQQTSHIALPAVDHRTHAFLADVAILKARECVGLHTLASALEHLESFTPLWEGSASTLGSVQDREVTLMRARILRFSGRFQEAYAILEALPQDNRTLSLVGTVLSEMGKCDEAILMLAARATEQAHVRGISQVQVTLANAYLMQCMQTYVRGGPLDWRSLQTTRKMFQELSGSLVLPTSYFSKMNHLSVLLGLAMVNHLEGQMDSALGAWQEALAVSQRYLPQGYTDMVICYSTSELEVRRGATVRSDILESQAREFFVRTGRQYHFTGLGTIWPDIIGRSLMARGRVPIIPIRD
ncbi:uncharacterized protein F4822DRAFT_423434 [Hypoxylon trugodes]|uniref:uncharacterized protein n=1 Tax=Hypoxylon trugodes TaxID=326681 RepID=UPI002195F78B|nr:uncharacterized protein F4822DRAFT_423434 [Hypoxylon trugodes]KAI1382599.1 hypothetical protein F4822DRAFT_423434 [Hypoxylon trugodes]